MSRGAAGVVVLLAGAVGALLGCAAVASPATDVRLVSRVAGERFEVLRDGAWEPFFVKGVNLGAALPGRFAVEFPDSAVYADWIAQMGEMGANTIRVYTRHPPYFYRALRAHNLANPDAALWLVHGVWAELPPDHYRYDDPAFEAAFYQDMAWVVDMVHGRASIPQRPGFAGGEYDADVSDWTLGYILGREWEPFSVVRYDSLRADVSGFRGRYVTVDGGGAMDAWLGRAAERIIAYETEAYGAQRPVAYTNWPTTDPLRHPTEATADEEVAIRRARGEDIERSPYFVGEDEVSLDPNRMRATRRFAAGLFASYHAYPYYPDFMLFDPEYRAAASPFGPSNYWGYLTRLREHHRGMPVIIGEYGVPASIGISHFNPQGWHHGGVTEAEMAAINARMTREIAAAGLAGGILFAWIDEWFKNTWITQQFESPRERGRLWYNRLDAEEHYGVIALEPEPRLPGETLDERLDHWRGVRPVYRSDQGTLRAFADEAYLWLLFDPGAGPAPRRVQVGFDILDPDRGERRWPAPARDPTPVAIEALLDAGPDTVRMLYHPGVQGAVITPMDYPAERLFTGPEIHFPPPGFFRGQYDIVEPLRMSPGTGDDGTYVPPRVLVHDRRFGPDSTEYVAKGYDRGVLREGPTPDGLWERRGGTLEVRIPWQLLNIGDPSARLALQDSTAYWKGGVLDAVPVPGVRITARTLGPGQRPAAEFPASGRRDDVALFTWDTWEQPIWRARRRPVFDAMRDVWADIEAAAARRAGPAARF